MTCDLKKIWFKPISPSRIWFPWHVNLGKKKEISVTLQEKKKKSPLPAFTTWYSDSQIYIYIYRNHWPPGDQSAVNSCSIILDATSKTVYWWFSQVHSLLCSSYLPIFSPWVSHIYFFFFYKSLKSLHCLPHKCRNSNVFRCPEWKSTFSSSAALPHT